jgi:hypothetical protein
MQFKLPHQEITPDLNRLLCRKVVEKEVYVSRMTPKHLAEIEAVCEEIKRRGLPEHFVLKKLKKNLGSGIFLHPKAAPLPRGHVVTPYSGKVSLCQQSLFDDSDYIFSLVNDITLTKEEQKHFDPKAKFSPRRLYSIDLDADKVGNFARFINHSEEPNVEARMLKVHGSYEIVYFTKKKVLPGEQLLVCYEGDDKSYWGALNIKPTPITPKTFTLDADLRVCEIIK